MSDSAVRLAIRAWFATPPIPGVQNVYRDEPWIVQGADWDVSTELGWGAILSIHLDSSEESRITLPALTGNKRVDHKVGVLIQYQYLIPDVFPDGVMEDDWVNGLDQIIDAVKTRIRSDPNMGTAPGGVIWEAGQSPADIRISRDLPKLDRGRVISWNLVEFDVTEIITA